MGVHAVKRYQPKRHYRGMTYAKAEEIRRLFFVERLKQGAIGARFSISQGNVSRIVSGQAWERRP
jgi:DNA-binding transcriptional regulator LsrR (DeoR family)